ncbi:hypothetical protein [Streptomyces sp. NPDC006739]|uniref:hypothetical protein n=1 Tax=Streptomyces sp. NPDC006739 TaxID=3364763 RepID=UPI0036B6147F
MSSDGAVLSVTVKPSLSAAWFHHLLTRPVVEVDGREFPARWGSVEMPIGSGEHRVAVFFRYRWQQDARLAESSVEFSADAQARRVTLTARLGARNGSRFRIGAPLVAG